MAKLEFGAWKPDLPENENPGALVVKNCIPLASSYRELKELVPFGDALDLPALGTYWLVSKAGSVFNFVGTADSLYLWDGASAYADISGPGGPFSAAKWEFVSFQERVIATDGGAGDLQYFDCDGTSVAFADLPGSPPRGACLGRVRDFLLVGDFETTDGSNIIEPGGFAWSAFNNTEMWTPSKATQAGYRLSRGEGGAVQRIVSGAEAVLFRENSIELIRYVGPPVIMQPDDITTLHGTRAPESVCWNREFAFYYSPEGFMKYDRRARQLTAIGDSVLDEWFLANAASSDLTRIKGVVDRKNKLVFWAFRDSASSIPFTHLLIYNYLNDRFAYAEIETEQLGEFVSTGYNLDTIGAVLSADDIDAASINVDDPAYEGGNFFLAGFNTAHRVCSFSGEPLLAEIDTTELSPDEDHRAYINGVKTMIEGSASTVVTVAAVTRDSLNDSPVAGSFAPLSARTQQHDMRVNARHFRFRVRISGGFRHARGIKMAFKRRGRQ